MSLFDNNDMKTIFVLDSTTLLDGTFMKIRLKNTRILPQVGTFIRMGTVLTKNYFNFKETNIYRSKNNVSYFFYNSLIGDNRAYLSLYACYLSPMMFESKILEFVRLELDYLENSQTKTFLECTRNLTTGMCKILKTTISL
jgi:hypothetical protein